MYANIKNTLLISIPESPKKNEKKIMKKNFKKNDFFRLREKYQEEIFMLVFTSCRLQRKKMTIV